MENEEAISILRAEEDRKRKKLQKQQVKKWKEVAAPQDGSSEDDPGVALQLDDSSRVF